MTVLGIDPGMDGAIVALDGSTARGWPLPTQKGVGLLVADLVGLLAEIRASSSPVRLVVVERAQSMPGQGVASMFRYGRDYGVLLGALAALGLPVVTVPPATWHRDLRLGGDPKAAAMAHVQGRLPSLELPRTKAKRLGVVDAACLALWGETR